MRATAQLASLPAFAAAALCLFSLVEPSVIAAGKDLSLTARAEVPAVQLLHPDHTLETAHWRVPYVHAYRRGLSAVRQELENCCNTASFT